MAGEREDIARSRLHQDDASGLVAERVLSTLLDIDVDRHGDIERVLLGALSDRGADRTRDGVDDCQLAAALPREELLRPGLDTGLADHIAGAVALRPEVF